MDEDKKIKENIVNEEKVPENWFIQVVPAIYRVIDPKTKTIIAEADDPESLRLQLTVISAQYASEAALGTR